MILSLSPGHARQIMLICILLILQVVPHASASEFMKCGTALLPREAITITNTSTHQKACSFEEQAPEDGISSVLAPQIQSFQINASGCDAQSVFRLGTPADVPNPAKTVHAIALGFQGLSAMQPGSLTKQEGIVEEPGGLTRGSSTVTSAFEGLENFSNALMQSGSLISFVKVSNPSSEQTFQNNIPQGEIFSSLPNPQGETQNSHLVTSVNNGNGTQTQSGTSNDRLFWTLPNFLTLENVKQAPPLTSKEKFKVLIRTSFDYVEYPFIAFLAAISQAEDSESGYGQGAAGYGKRYGAYFADNTIENFWTGAILPSLLHQDPRYYQLGKGGFFQRSGYALSRQFVTHSDSGHTQFNFSEVVGSMISAGISNTYHPVGDRTFGNTMSVWWTQVAWDSVASVVKEFWPDIRRKASKHNVTNRQP
jgi:hypothetical protein